MHYLMGTLVSVEIEGTEESQGIKAIYAAFDEMQRLENLLSCFKPDSEISLINAHASSKPCIVSPETFKLLQTSIYYAEMTGGLFDITLGRVQDVWRLAKKTSVLPSKNQITQALGETGYGNLVLDDSDLSVYFKCIGLKVDMGGIAKGYAIDKAIAVLKSFGITQATVNAGGNIHYIGKQASFFGVKNPLDPDSDPIMRIQLLNEAIATTANYEQAFEIQGQTYGHVLDAETGYPLKGELLSASVITDSGIHSDALSTCLFAMGPNLIPQLESRGCVCEVVKGNSPIKLATNSSLILRVNREIKSSKISNA